jgi:hypothetical protein
MTASWIGELYILTDHNTAAISKTSVYVLSGMLTQIPGCHF